MPCQCCCLMSWCFARFDTHCTEDLQITLLFGGLSWEVRWRKPDQNEIFYSACQLCCIILKENMMPKLAAHWDLGKLLEGSSFGCEVNAKWDEHGECGVCKLGFLPIAEISVTAKRHLEMVGLLEKASLHQFQPLVSGFGSKVFSALSLLMGRTQI